MSMLQKVLTRRFVIFSILQALALCACIILSIEQFGEAELQQQEKVGLILARSRDTLGWPKEMALGLQQACEEMGYDFYIEDQVDVGTGACRQAIEKLVGKGVKYIFLANPGFQAEAEEMAAKYPKVNFFANSVGEHVSDKILNYSVRYYEVRYMAGVLAGLHTRTGIVGYVAPFPAVETRRAINAFALGVQSVRPDARILVKWTRHWISPESEQEAVYQLKLEGVDVLAYFVSTHSVAEAAEKHDLAYIDFHHSPYRSGNCLAAIETDWRAVYADLLRIISRKEASADRVYWRGMFDKVIWLWPTSRLTPAEETALVRTRTALWQGYPVFSGHIVDQGGNLRCMEGEAISSNDVQNKMNWLVKGVEVIEAR